MDNLANARRGQTDGIGETLVFVAFGKSLDAYFAAYGHWGGAPPRLVNQHPNPKAHHLLGTWVAEALAPGAPLESAPADARD